MLLLSNECDNLYKRIMKEQKAQCQKEKNTTLSISKGKQIDFKA